MHQDAGRPALSYRRGAEVVIVYAGCLAIRATVDIQSLGSPRVGAWQLPAGPDGSGDPPPVTVPTIGSPSSEYLQGAGAMGHAQQPAEAAERAGRGGYRPA